MLSALPTQPAHGLPTDQPFPLPFPEAEPLRVEQYGPPAHFPLAPPVFLSAFDNGCAVVVVPRVAAVPLLTWLEAELDVVGALLW